MKGIALKKVKYFNAPSNRRDEDFTALLAPKNFEQEIPTNRTQTPSEAVEHSLLTSLASINTYITEQEVDEAFCRDTEAFSEAFQVDDLYHRPPDCQPLEHFICAVLLDRWTNVAT